MMKFGRRQRHVANAYGHYTRPQDAKQGAGAKLPVGSVVSGRKARPGVLKGADGKNQRVMLHENLLSDTQEVKAGSYTEGSSEPATESEGTNISANGMGMGGGGIGFGTAGGTTGFGGANSKVDRFNPIYDNLSRGTVAEDWIPQDPRQQNQMFRMMFSRGQVEGPVVETISELCWSDFDLTGIRDQKILDTYEAAKEAVRVDRYLGDITKEYLVIGRVIIQMVLDASMGIWTDMIIHNSDYIKVGEIPRTGYMPKLDLLPSPNLQAWVKSTDERDVESRKGLPKKLLEDFAANKAVPLDPTVTAYLPRRSFFDDIYGTSFYVRNIPLWGLEKSLINATLTGHRRRAGPITQIAMGSEQWEPTPEQIDAVVSAYTAAEDDTVSSTIGTRYDVSFNQIRGGLQEMWKWSDDFDFLQTAKMRMFGVSEALITGDQNIDTTTAPTIFLERLKAHRKYVVETFLQQKFFRALALVHNFRKRSEAELSHRIRVNGDDHELILPTLVFHRNLDNAADTARADLLDKMEEKGLPVGAAEWNRTLGGGEIMDRMRTAAEDLEFKLNYAKFLALKKQVDGLIENAGETDDLDAQTDDIRSKLKNLSFAKDQDGPEAAKLSRKGKRRAEDMVEGEGQGNLSSSSYKPLDTKTSGDAYQDLSIDRSRRNLDLGTLNMIGKVC